MKKVLPFLLLILLFSCKKDNTESTIRLISGSWKMSAWTILTPFEGTPLEGYSNNWFKAGTCYSDMLWIYKSDGSFLNVLPGTCAGASAGFDTLYGRWSLLDNNQTIKVDYTHGGYANFKFKIIELSPTKMVVQRVERTGVAAADVNDYREMDLLNQYEFIPE